MTREEIRSGRAAYERKLAVASGSATLAAEDRAELLAVLALDPDERIATRAKRAILTVPVESFLAALGRSDAAPELFLHCAENLVEKPGIADALAEHVGAPERALALAAQHVTTKGLDSLTRDLDRLTSNPALLAVLRRSPAATVKHQQTFAELAKGLPDAAELREVAEGAEVAEADPVKRKTLLQRLSQMRVVERVQMALKGNREERMALIRDPNKVVQRAVLQSPRLTETEVEAFAAMSSLSEEVLRVIAANRAWAKNYIVTRSLLNNSKCPLEVTLHILPRLTPKDLKSLSINKNVPDTLRSVAAKLYRQRAKGRE